jgi:hypothetical protein
MGKASSSKKVARAAGIGGGHTHRRATPWGYLGVIALIVVLGIVGTVASRERRLTQINSQGNTAPTVGTLWHEGYAVYECGQFVAPITSKNNPEGIHTDNTPAHAGIIIIDPTVKAAAGKNATLGVFASAVGMKLNAAELQVPGGKLYQDGDSCEGQPGHVYVMQFDYVGAKGQLYNGAKGQLPRIPPNDVPLGDQQLLTIAFVPADKASRIPAPPSYVTANLDRLAASATTSTTSPGPTTSPPTTSKAGSPTTTKAGAPTTTRAASGRSTTSTTVKKS